MQDMLALMRMDRLCEQAEQKPPDLVSQLLEQKRGELQGQRASLAEQLRERISEANSHLDESLKEAEKREDGSSILEGIEKRKIAIIQLRKEVQETASRNEEGQENLAERSAKQKEMIKRLVSFQQEVKLLAEESSNVTTLREIGDQASHHIGKNPQIVRRIDDSKCKHLY